MPRARVWFLDFQPQSNFTQLRIFVTIWSPYILKHLPNLDILVITKKCVYSEEKAYEQILRKLKSDLKIVTSPRTSDPLPQSIIKWNKTSKNIERETYIDEMSFYNNEFDDYGYDTIDLDDTESENECSLM